MRTSTLLAAGVSLLGFAAALPEAYPAAADFDVVGRLGKRATINNLEPRERKISASSFGVVTSSEIDTNSPPVCNGSIVLDPSTQTYTIASGDTLTKIAASYHRGICDIAKFNNISDPNFILAGASLTIPPQVCLPDSSSCISTSPPTTCVNGGPGFYIVQSGDALGRIAGAFNLTLDAVESANKINIPNPDVISVGQVVNIPLCDNSVCEVSPYKIKAGDTFYILGRRYRSTEGQIRSVNPGVNPNELQIGQVITLISYCHKFPGTEPSNEL